MANDIVTQIEQPNEPLLQNLREKAVTETKTNLEQTGIRGLDDWVIQKMAYTHYHNRETDTPRYLFLCQDPGPADKIRHGEYAREINRLGSDHSPVDIVDAHRDIGRNWLLNNNTHFTKNFLQRCAEHGLIELSGGWEHYLKQDEFFNDFYMTDIVKYRTGEYDTTHAKASFDAFLLPELKAHDFDLIFTFGKTAWKTVRQRLDARLAAESEEWVNHEKMGDAHGQLYQTNRTLETSVLPLSHMSGHSYNTFPREEYLDQLRSGLMEFSESPH